MLHLALLRLGRRVYFSLACDSQSLAVSVMYVLYVVSCTFIAPNAAFVSKFTSWLLPLIGGIAVFFDGYWITSDHPDQFPLSRRWQMCVFFLASAQRPLFMYFVRSCSCQDWWSWDLKLLQWHIWCVIVWCHRAPCNFHGSQEVIEMSFEAFYTNKLIIKVFLIIKHCQHNNHMSPLKLCSHSPVTWIDYQNWRDYLTNSTCDRIF